MLRQGLAAIASWMTFGLLLEGLLGYKHPAYLDDPPRRELLRLAHAHGTLLGLLLVAAALAGKARLVRAPRAATLSLRIGTVLLPAGFLLAGLWHYGGDPGPAIWLVPAAALVVIFGVIALALGAAEG